MSDTGHAFWEQQHTGFGKAGPEDDLLHPRLALAEPGYALSETHYLSFNVPEHGIHAIGYMWHHPHLNTVMGGLAVWQGFTPHPLTSEIWDYVGYMSDACLAGDLHHFRLENSYEVRTLEPLKRHRMTYANEAEDSWVDVGFEALMPPVMASNGYHFEQPVRTHGTLRLRGRDYEVRGLSMRDRSFGQLRKENHAPIPPLAWMLATFSEDFAFSCTACDDPATGPEWLGKLALPPSGPLRSGWVWKDGQLSEVASVFKRTTRRPGSLYPDRIEMTLVDLLGRRLDIVGTSIAGVNWQTWQNMDSNVCLIRWECDGKVTHGDCQEGLWPDYVYACHPGQNARNPG